MAHRGRARLALRLAAEQVAARLAEGRQAPRDVRGRRRALDEADVEATAGKRDAGADAHDVEATGHGVGTSGGDVPGARGTDLDGPAAAAGAELAAGAAEADAEARRASPRWLREQARAVLRLEQLLAVAGEHAGDAAGRRLHHVRARAAEHRVHDGPVRVVCDAAGNEHVRARGADQAVSAADADEQVVAAVPFEQVVARAADQPVRPAVASEG